MAFCLQSCRTVAEIVTGYRHCVISLSLTVSDARALGKGIELNPHRLDRYEARALVFRRLSPMLGQSPTADWYGYDGRGRLRPHRLAA